MKRFHSIVLIIAMLGILCAAAFAQAPPDVMSMVRGMQYGPMTLLSRPEVSKELKLNKTQTEAIRKLQKEFGAENSKRMKDAQAGDPAKMMDMFKEMQAVQADYTKRALEPLDEGQRKRFEQIRLQVLSAQAAFDPDVQAALEVTDSQKHSLSALSREYNHGSLRMVSAASDPGKMRKMRDALNTEFSAKVTDILTADQNAKYKELQGPPFKDVDKLRVP